MITLLQIASNSNVNFQTLKKLWPKLEQDRIVVSTRTLGGAILYKINVNNPVVKKLIELNNFLCWEKADKEQEVSA